MTKDTLPFGVAGIIIGIAIYVKTKSILPALVPTIIGIGLILFYKTEEKNSRKKKNNHL